MASTTKKPKGEFENLVQNLVMGVDFAYLCV